MIKMTRARMGIGKVVKGEDLAEGKGRRKQGVGMLRLQRRDVERPIRWCGRGGFSMRNVRHVLGGMLLEGMYEEVVRSSCDGVTAVILLSPEQVYAMLRQMWNMWSWPRSLLLCARAQTLVGDCQSHEKAAISRFADRVQFTSQMLILISQHVPLSTTVQTLWPPTQESRSVRHPSQALCSSCGHAWFTPL